MKIYRVSAGVYIRTRAALSPDVAIRVDPADVDEMRRAREYFCRCGLTT